jgi:intracellular multiplication protein IcmK
MVKRFLSQNLIGVLFFSLMVSAYAQEPAATTTTTTTTQTQLTPPNAQPPVTQLQQFQQQWAQNQNANGIMPTTNTATTTTTTTFAPPPPRVRSTPPLNLMPRRQSVRSARVLTFEQGQQAMLETAPPTAFPADADSIAAFNAMVRQNMPLTPQQVVQLRQQIDVSQRAASITPNIPPKPVSTTIMINLAPGTTPPAVRLAQGYVSSLVFVDSTGSPWPIASFDIGDPKAVNIQWDGKSNVLLLQAVNPYSTGNIVLRLVGLPTPISLELVSGQRVVDYRVDLHVPGIGPNTKDLPMGEQLPNSANQLLLGVLDGIAPAGSRFLTVRGADAQAWLLGEKMYLRTRLTLLSPGWMGKMVSPDGMNAYELPKTSSVLVSRYGEPAELKIEGF